MFCNVLMPLETSNPALMALLTAMPAAVPKMVPPAVPRALAALLLALLGMLAVYPVPKSVGVDRPSLAPSGLSASFMKPLVMAVLTPVFSAL